MSIFESKAAAGTPEKGGWPGGEAQEIEPTQRIITKRVRRKGRSSADPFEILGVKRGARSSEIRAAYLRLVKEHHPDVRAPGSETPDTDAAERLKTITAAYRKLKAERRSARKKALCFAVGALTSTVPLLALAMAYLAGWPRIPTPTVALARVESQDQGKAGATGSTSVQKDSAVGRQAAFDDAKKHGTRAAWTKFIADYPGGEPEVYARQALAAIDQAEAAEARKREERLAWSMAEKGTKADLEQFLAEHPDDEHAAEARAALAAIAEAGRAAWAAAERAGTKEALQHFLKQHPDAAEAAAASKALAALAAAEAKTHADLASWARAEAAGTKAALLSYLAEHPSGLRSDGAKARVARLEAEERDDEAWRAASDGNRKSDYAGYLKAHPDGRRAADARMRIAELELAETLFAAKEDVKEARVSPVKAPAVKAPRPPVEDDMPFVGADGRIRR